LGSASNKHSSWRSAANKHPSGRSAGILRAPNDHSTGAGRERIVRSAHFTKKVGPILAA
jgi:hypothetical protein